MSKINRLLENAQKRADSQKSPQQLMEESIKKNADEIVSKIDVDSLHGDEILNKWKELLSKFLTTTYSPFELKLNNRFYKIMSNMDNQALRKNMTINFNFRFIKLNNTDFCFNNNGCELQHYVDLLERLGKVSNETCGQVESERYNQHPIVFEELNDIQISLFIPHLAQKLKWEEDQVSICFYKEEKMFQLFQIRIITNGKKDKASRLIGFFFDDATFYPLLFDVKHQFYPEQNKSIGRP